MEAPLSIDSAALSPDSISHTRDAALAPAWHYPTSSEPHPARSLHRVHGRDRTDGFTVATELIVLALFMATAECDLSILPMITLNLASLAYMVAAHQPRMAAGMLAFLAVVGPVFVIYTAYGVRPIILSPIQIYQMWHAFPVMAAACIVFMTPPGLISAALARIHCPKRIILGTLVFLRFFPTFCASWRLLRDALRKRGLTRAHQMIANPVDTYEYVMVPTLLALVNSADQLASSAVTRAAEAPKPRTSYYAKPLRTADIVCIVAAIAICAGALYANGTIA